MSVGNVDRRNLRKCVLNHRDIRFVCDHPPPVSDAILTDEIIHRCLLFELCDLLRKFLFGPVCQKDRSGLHAAGIYMVDTVFLLIRSGILMLFNDIVPVIIDGRTSHHSGLTVPVHGQLIEVKARRRILYEFSFPDPLPKHLIRLFIDAGCVSVHIIGKLRLRPVDRQKRFRILLHHLTGFLSVIYIIGKRRDFLFHSPAGTICHKWSDLCHVLPPEYLDKFILPNTGLYLKAISINK